jgi:hypothetical protein
MGEDHTPLLQRLQAFKEKLRGAKRQQSVDLQTTSNFNVGNSLASRFSYLAGGGTKKQVSADTGANIGMTLGGLAGGTIGRRYLRAAIDDAVKNPELLKDTAWAYARSASGKTIPSKVLAGHGLSSTLRFLKNMPKPIRSNALKWIGATAGGIAGGYTLGGTIGHNAADDVDGLPIRLSKD